MAPHLERPSHPSTGPPRKAGTPETNAFHPDHSKKILVVGPWAVVRDLKEDLPISERHMRVLTEMQEDLFENILRIQRDISDENDKRIWREQTSQLVDWAGGSADFEGLESFVAQFGYALDFVLAFCPEVDGAGGEENLCTHSFDVHVERREKIFEKSHGVADTAHRA
ncbi:hypothetical protein F1880_003667 [Penicillium rolfsii]|nr:hypothetical protein F1880_003667 [Penicillium rolfsii]